jgi:hypothetical protein
LRDAGAELVRRAALFEEAAVVAAMIVIAERNRHYGLASIVCYAPQSSEEIQMKVALLSLALFGTELMTPVSDRVPELNVDALCKSRSADDKKMQLSVSQSVEDCVRDEKSCKAAAKHCLGINFPSHSRSLRR